MAAVFAIVIAPNVWWLVNNDFMPFHYVDDRAAGAARWYHYLLFPLHWTGGQLLYLLPALALLALLYLPRRPVKRRTGQTTTTRSTAAMSRALALGPFAVTTVVAAVLGRQPIAMWGYPLWSFVPLAVLMVWPPALEAGAAAAVCRPPRWRC